MENENTEFLFNQLRQGDEEASREIFNRYFDRLIGLAHSRLSAKLGQKVDPDDVVQSALRSFFLRSRDGQYSIERSADLWKLLAAITRNKLLKKAEQFQQKKRRLDRNQALSDFYDIEELFAAEPTETEAVALSDEVEFLMRDLKPLQRKILEMRLQGQTIPHVSEAVKRSERTVRRFLSGFRVTLEERLQSLREG